ncbi:MAG: hypothetical protein IT178_18350 [Acidobacteria bacterium]|nr:hypothetical protein [Acidobacteriota bacterium]
MKKDTSLPPGAHEPEIPTESNRSGRRRVESVDAVPAPDEPRTPSEPEEVETDLDPRSGPQRPGRTETDAPLPPPEALREPRNTM